MISLILWQTLISIDTQNVFLISLTLPPFVSVNPNGKENKARTNQKVIKRTASSLTDLCFSPLPRDWELLLQLHTLLKFFQMYRLGLGFTWKVMSWSHVLDWTRLAIWLEICYWYTYAEVTCIYAFRIWLAFSPAVCYGSVHFFSI